ARRPAARLIVRGACERAANHSHLYGPIILLIVALCIDRGVRRFEKAAILFARPATTMAFPCKSARTPLAATGRGFIVRRRSKGDAAAPAAASKPVAVCPGQRLVTTTPCGRSSSCNASPKAST